MVKIKQKELKYVGLGVDGELPVENQMKLVQRVEGKEMMKKIQEVVENGVYNIKHIVKEFEESDGVERYMVRKSVLSIIQKNSGEMRDQIIKQINRVYLQDYRFSVCRGMKEFIIYFYGESEYGDMQIYE